MSTHKFDPNAASLNDSGVFGLPFTQEQASLVFLPIPWEATTSYGGGTSDGPAAILEASRQVDLYDLDVERPYEAGLYMMKESAEVRSWNEEGKAEAQKIIAASGVIDGNPALQKSLKRVNELSEKLNSYVYAETKKLLAQGKIVGIVGGDHSVPLGAFQAMAEKHPSFGVLHFDAHSDTRNAYEGFEFSHASIMNNALKLIPQLTKLTQVGIRDFCEEEVNYCKSLGERVKIFFDAHLARRKFEGESWKKITTDIISTLPKEVWISFDIDGLDPKFCPHTGTPVPGGLDFQEAAYIFSQVVASGRKIIGFDLNEVSPNLDNENDEWDANVGARLLYKLAAWTLASQGKAKLNQV
ncbi:MAG: agmatinase family protein [Methylotenera sp.]|nr:agmatinase family protein [Oligoflexia bacterium]